MDSARVDVEPVVERRLLAISLSILTVLIAATLAADTMPLSQIQKGMRGYGVTVFEGNRLEKFDVAIVGVRHNSGPRQDLILAKVDSPMVQRAGVVAGMSGSPVYIDGKVIGALAYSWQFAKEPVAGITTFAEMPKMAALGRNTGAVVVAASPRMAGGEFTGAMANPKTTELFGNLESGFMNASPAGVKPIAIPLSLSSFAPETISRFSNVLDAMGFVAVPSGSNGAQPPAAVEAEFRPGDAIGAVLLNGDFNVAATGTVTFIDGNRIYAFGHPFLDIGEVSFPMAKSEIVTVMPSLASSFKFASTGQVVGAFRQDRSTGIMGMVGDNADMIPIDVTVDGSGLSQSYHVNIVRHSLLSPLILAMAADSVVANAQRAAGERTVLLDSEIKLKGFQEPIHLRDGWAGAQARQAIPAYLAVVAGYVMSNEFRAAEIERVRIVVRHDDQLKIARLVEAALETPTKGRISPGDTVKVRTVLKAYRGEPFVEIFDVKIPDNQPPGNAYLLVGSGSLANQIDFSLVPPDPRNLEQVIVVLLRLRRSSDFTIC